MTIVSRPWGNFRVIETQEAFQIKQLTVLPDSRLSLQSHEFRAEHWFVIQGCARVEVDGRILELIPGESIQIPLQSRHRVTAIGETSLVFIEIQTGTSFDEDDIIRYEDDYGRS
jgi:mannose-6-phosphate isomerase-like protein (cupin superfamily)